MPAALPLSLYIHIPWCIRKCPYCDFNSHEAKDALPQMLYVNALLQELDQHLPTLKDRPLVSLFFGGGTPSLFSGESIQQILTGVRQRFSLSPQFEITLEANPGTVDQASFHAFHQAGVNRLSMGIQSLQDDKLKALGRIHHSEEALRAIALAKGAGFTNFNLDIMYGLPNQTQEDALSDIQAALAARPTHFSWYQLTIEPNTFFHHHPPTLPDDDLLSEMQEQGQQLIHQHGFQHYEVSAYTQPGFACQHNLNYWEFGDYLGIGAGAHSKLTDPDTGVVQRFAQVKHPRDYLDAAKRQAFKPKTLSSPELIFEFMLNTLRLTEGVLATLFTERTGLPFQDVKPMLAQARERGLLTMDAHQICASPLGKRFLNDLVACFLNTKTDRNKHPQSDKKCLTQT